MSLTVDDMVSQVRAQLDETNTANVTDQELVDALNRVQRKAWNIAVRVFPDLAWSQTSFNTTSGTTNYDIPSEAYGRKINHLTANIGNTQYLIKRISNHRKLNYTFNSQVHRPFYYTVVKNQLQVFPPPAQGITIEVHYTDDPESLVQKQGRIETINTGSNYVIVDALGSDLSTTISGFNSYANIIDYNTGAVKTTLQVNEIDTNTRQVTFKSTPTRTSVLGKTISTSIPSTVEQDDFICLITGTCVSELPLAYVDYLMQGAVLDIRRRLGERSDEEYRHYKELEEELRKMWVGREARYRIRKSNAHWKGSFSNNVRRLFS